MKTIRIGDQKVNIPERCDDLSEKDYIYMSRQIYRYVTGEIDSFDVKLYVLMNAINLKVMDRHRGMISYADLFRYLRVFLWSWLKKKMHLITKEGHKEICLAARNCFLRKEQREDYLCENLVGMCDEIKFLQGEKMDLSFTKNPIRKIKGIGTGKRFDIGVVLLTDLSAGEYADAMDLAIAWEETMDPKLLDMLVATLYYKRRKEDGMISISDNSRLQKRMSKIDIAVKYGVYLWFVSISSYFFKHPTYSLLYVSKPGETTEKIRLGMSEGIFRLSKAGYGSHSEIRNKNLVEFMDMQLAEMKSSIHDAIAAGVEQVKLAEQTGYSLTQIEMLS